MNILSILILLILAGAAVYFFRYKPSTPTTGSGQSILTEVQQGNVETSINAALPVSFNQPEGMVFSYSMWILIKDFTVGYGKQRRILSRGDCPGVYIDSTSNSLVVAVDTYGSKETILIPNIPAMKWMHLAIVVNQQAVDIYINGTLRQHHTLSQLPKQNKEPVKIGPNWDGVIGQVGYYPRELTYTEISTMSSQAPPNYKMPIGTKADYFDITWYTGRLNSS